jgi:Leucine-rich repeat (LRR) protein
MFNFFKTKTTVLDFTKPEKQSDLELIKQLEQTIGKKLPKLDEIEYDSVGYTLNNHNQITGLGLYKCGLKELPPEIVKLQNLTVLYLSVN